MPIAIQNIETGLYKSWGYVASGALGIPPVGYCEVEIETLPLEADMEAPPLTLAQQLDAIFMTLPPSIKAQFYGQKSAIKLALEAIPSDVETARLMLVAIEVPSELMAIKTAMLGLFPTSDEES